MGSTLVTVDASHPLRLNGSGHEVQGPDYGYDVRRRHERPHVVLQLTLAGRGYHEDDEGVRRSLPPGHAFLERFPGPFRYGAEGDRYELVFLSAAGVVAEAMASHAHATFGPAFEVADAAGLSAAMLALHADRVDAALPADEHAVSARVYGLFARALSGAAAVRRAGAGEDPVIADAMRLIAEHAADRSLSVARLAERLSVSREHLARTFARRTGTSPADAIAVARLRLAASLLRATDDKLDVVARKSGFAGANYLCRVFRRRVGVTPAAFRRRPWLAGP